MEFISHDKYFKMCLEKLTVTNHNSRIIVLPLQTMMEREKKNNKETKVNSYKKVQNICT